MDRNETRQGRWRVVDWGWFLAWTVGSSLWCMTASMELGATFDEPFYISQGLEFWRTGSHSGLLKKGTMPLPVDVVTLPLYLWEQWQGITFDPDADLDRLLPVARAGTLAFWWLLLAYAWKAGHSLAGPWAARLSVAWIASEPNFLAHASLATTDIAITACLLALLYHFGRGRQAGWARRIGVPALWFTAALLAKSSALLFGPLGLLAVEAERLVRSGVSTSSSTALSSRAWLQAFSGLQPFRRDMLHIFLLAICLTFIYCGTDWRVNQRFVSWAQTLPDGAAARGVVWVAEHLRIFNNAGDGLFNQITHNLKGHGAYLLGEVHQRALWYYFPVLLTIKVTLPLLFIPILVAIVRPGALVNWACLSAAVLLALSPAFRVQIGIRMILPILALAVVGLSAAIVQVSQEATSIWKRRLAAAGAIATLLWTPWSALTIWPNGLCHINELWSGTQQTYRLESSCDWGQGLKELARWQLAQGLPELAIWYFGTDPALKRLPMQALQLHTAPFSPEDLAATLRGQYLAVSTSLLYGPIVSETHRAIAFLRARPSVAQTTTFLIYDFTGKDGRTE